MCTNFEIASVILEICIVREPATTPGRSYSWLVTPGTNPHLLPFRRLGIFVLSIYALVDSAEYLAIDSGGNVSGLVVARNCCMARMLPGEAEFVSE